MLEARCQSRGIVRGVLRDGHVNLGEHREGSEVGQVPSSRAVFLVARSSAWTPSCVASNI